MLLPSNTYKGHGTQKILWTPGVQLGITGLGLWVYII